MGFGDSVRRAQEQQAEEKRLRAVARSPEGHRYVWEVNKGSINMLLQTQRTNEMWAKGFRVHTVLSQDGNTIIVYEKRDD